MLKAIKKSIKKLGSHQRLDAAGAQAAAAPQTASATAEALATQSQHQPAGPGQAAAAVGADSPPRGEPSGGVLPSPPRPVSPPPHGHPQNPPQRWMPMAVDYELVAGPLELDCSLQHDEEAGGQHLEAGGPGDAAAEPPSQQQQPAPDAAAEDGGERVPSACREQHVWQDSAQSSGGPSAEDEAASAGEAGGGDGGGAAAAKGAAEAAAAAEAAGITAALATMMYLTEEGQGDCGNDCMSVVSDALSEEDLPDDISELSRALEALEGETLGSSPASAAGPSSLGGAASGSIDDQLAERLGISPDAGDPTVYSQQMAKLYNNLGLKMMERRKHEEALGLLRKAEAIVENEAMWVRAAGRRQRMQAITYNNLGCLYKRHNMPQVALQYLQKALALEEGDGLVQNSSSTHLNISAAFSALKRPKEALAHAERAIILLQSHLWPHHLPFQDGLSLLTRQLAAPGAPFGLLASANVLAMSYHNAAVEHEKLGRLREALVSFTRAYLIASKCLGAKAQMTGSLHKALKAFQQRQARYLPAGAAHAARKAPSLAAHPTKRVLGSRGAGKSAASSKASSSLAGKSMGSLAAAAANGKATLPLDKASRTVAAALAGARPPSASRLTSQLQ